MKIKIFQILSIIFYVLIISCKHIRTAPLSSSSSSSAIYCFDKLNCIAVGTYTNIYNYQFPLVSFTNDGGLTFISNEATQFTLPGDALLGPGQMATLSALTCFNLFTCLAVGYYTNLNNATVPLIAISNDGGQTFSATPTFTPTIFVPPSDAVTDPGTFMGFTGLQCPALFNCTAFGAYTISATVPQTYVPLEATSFDNGYIFVGLTASESYIPPPDAEPNGPGTLAFFSGAQCSLDNFCIATGSYESAGNVTTPLIAFNNNGGTQFTGESTAAFPLPDPTATGGNFLGITCVTPEFCLMVGNYQILLFGSVLPLVAITKDGGKTLAYDSPTSFTFPSDTLYSPDGNPQFVQLNGIFCFSDLNCLALGVYATISFGAGGATLPFRAFSTDGGLTFTGISGSPPSITLPSDAKADNQSASFGQLFLF